MVELVTALLAAGAGILSYLNRRAIRTTNGTTLAQTVEAVDEKVDKIIVTMLDHVTSHPGKTGTQR